jgi:hypothetical protein
MPLTVERQQSASSILQNAARAALLLPLVLPGCSSLSLPAEDAPASGPDPTYNRLVADHLEAAFKDHDSYDAFEISDFRWVHGLKGWNWLTCVRFLDKEGRRRTYALFIKKDEIVDSHYAVESDKCAAQTYAPLVLMGGMKGATSAGALY